MNLMHNNNYYDKLNVFVLIGQWFKSLRTNVILNYFSVLFLNYVGPFLKSIMADGRIQR